MLPAPIATSAAEILPQQVQAIRQKAGAVVVELLRQRGGNLQGKVTYRDLQFSDLLSGTVRGTNSGTINTTYASLIANVTLPVNQAVAIFGLVFYDAIPNLDAIKYQLGGAQTVGWVKLTTCYGDNRVVKLYHEPVYWGPQEIIQIQAVAQTSTSASNANFDFIGYVAEPTGLNWTPREDLDDLVKMLGY